MASRPQKEEGLAAAKQRLAADGTEDSQKILANKYFTYRNKSQWLIGDYMNIWRLETCKAATGYRSTASIYQLIKKGLWPQPVKINIRSVGWPDAEILAINAARIAGQTDEQIRELVLQLHAKRSELLQVA